MLWMQNNKFLMKNPSTFAQSSGCCCTPTPTPTPTITPSITPTITPTITLTSTTPTPTITPTPTATPGCIYYTSSTLANIITGADYGYDEFGNPTLCPPEFTSEQYESMEDPYPEFTAIAAELMQQLNETGAWENANAGYGCDCTGLAQTYEALPNISVSCGNDGIAIVTDNNCSEDCCQTKQTVCGFGASARCCGDLDYGNMIELISETTLPQNKIPGFAVNQLFTITSIGTIEGEERFQVSVNIPGCTPL